VIGTQEAEDGYDVIETLAKMEWCNGSVGLAGNAGNSYLAIV
jgi:predicted acyl esterase